MYLVRKIYALDRISKFPAPKNKFDKIVARVINTENSLLKGL